VLTFYRFLSLLERILYLFMANGAWPFKLYRHYARLTLNFLLWPLFPSINNYNTWDGEPVLEKTPSLSMHGLKKGARK
jgi:hypothetical protein